MITEIEKYCQNLLQKTVSFEIKNKLQKNAKILKSGKVIIFRQRNFHICFVLENSKKGKEKLEIPIPFDVEYYKDEGLTFFDYRICKFIKMAEDAEIGIRLLAGKKTKNKFFDSILTIIEHPNIENYEN